MKTLEQLGISPSPWKMEYSNDIDRVVNITDANDKTIVETDYGFYPPELPDARVMTAAPDMYKRGFELVSALEDWMQKYPPSEFSTFGQAYQLLVGAVNNFRAALSKAAGESEVEK